jgi:hypothetical protein
LKISPSKINFGAWKQEDSMKTYEIRILRMDGSPAVITQQKYLNADAAIAAAKLMSPDRRFEVWNDDYCVYTASLKPETAQRPPTRPAA